jgi:hypothetical protein
MVVHSFHRAFPRSLQECLLASPRWMCCNAVLTAHLAGYPFDNEALRGTARRGRPLLGCITKIHCRSCSALTHPAEGVDACRPASSGVLCSVSRRPKGTLPDHLGAVEYSG